PKGQGGVADSVLRGSRETRDKRHDESNDEDQRGGERAQQAHRKNGESHGYLTE
ncbi:MAG: hypothetical protein RIQ93_2338, partial [Verrucomicrobiota bacterium]